MNTLAGNAGAAPTSGLRTAPAATPNNGADAGAVARMLHGPLVPTLMRLAAPNIMGLFAMTVVIGYDGFILGRLGANALAGVALVLPLSMLMLQMSAGGIGGATTAAVARALGAGKREEAEGLAQHAVMIAALAGLLFTVLLVGGGHWVFAAMGGRAGALEQALAYSHVMFGGAVLVWFTNVLAGIVRGAGNMLLPSLALLGMAVMHVFLCPLLVFGAGEWRGLGVAGAAASTLCANAAASLVLAVHLLRRNATVRLTGVRWRLRRPHFAAILRVGIPASLSPVISNGSIALATAFVGAYGTAALAGYGVAARLEYILVPIAFGFGTALTAMVATNIGAGQAARASRVAWTGAGVVFAITGAIGLVGAIWPSLWMHLFTGDAAVRDWGAQYLRIVGGSYGLFGLGLALFFASQGAGRMAWPLVASLARLVAVGWGGWLCVQVLHVPAATFFGVVAFSFVAYAVTLAAAIRFGGWAR